MIIFPKAKINLGLKVTGKRADGYHDIETNFYPVGLCDALEFVVSSSQEKKDILTISGINPVADHEKNIVISTIEKLRENYKFPSLKIHLHKAIPVGAGLGGGSSDAAFLLVALNRCFKLNISNIKLKEIALEVGSDCPFFIDNVPAYAAGRGEILLPIRNILDGYYLIILNPSIKISTREAFQNVRPSLTGKSLLQLTDSPVASWKEAIRNDFEEFAFSRFPVLREIKEGLYLSGAVFSLMSGSGSSVYGIYSEKPDLPDHLKKFLIYEGLL